MRGQSPCRVAHDDGLICAINAFTSFSSSSSSCSSGGGGSSRRIDIDRRRFCCEIKRSAWHSRNQSCRQHAYARCVIDLLTPFPRVARCMQLFITHSHDSRHWSRLYTGALKSTI